MPIPDELKLFRQWIVWKSVITPEGKVTKLPYAPLLGSLASVTDSNTWTDYETACRIASVGAFSGIGFVLTELDPYAFIDLDDPKGDADVCQLQQRIASSFETYGEISPSGRGLHLIVKGKVPVGRKRNHVEVYSSARYMTMTGNTFYNRPIGERQYLLEQLWGELGVTRNGFNHHEVESQPEIASDEQIYNMAQNAENGMKFLSLWRGEWQAYYRSQSEADFALVNILGFYSRNIEQIYRLFMLSNLGKREKAIKRKNYVMHMIRRSFDNLPPEIPMQELSQNIQNEIILDSKSNPFAGPLFQNIADEGYDWTLPPGLLGDIASFIYEQSPRPVKEVSLAGAIGLMAGICGRSYNVSSTGLNQYVLLLTKSGIGKESASKGIDTIMKAVCQQVPSAEKFIGPADIASGQALTKYLPDNPCFVSVVGEFGLVLKQICSIHANGAEVRLRKMLLALYNKSGTGQTLRPTIYSDKDQTTKAIDSPSFSLFGDSIPDTFYQSIDDTMVNQGLFPRFTVIEYRGNRTEYNENFGSAKVPDELIQKLGSLCAQSHAMNEQNRVIHIGLSEDALKLSRQFNARCDALINGTELEIIRQLWTRAHIKALKLAGLLAVGMNFNYPTITVEALQWAINLVERDINGIMERFEAGRTGQDATEAGQIEEARLIVAEFLMRPYDKTMAQSAVSEDMHKNRIISVSYLQRKLISKNTFKMDRIGATAALKRVIASFVTDGALVKVPPIAAWNQYRKSAEIYTIVDASRFVGSILLQPVHQ